MLAIQDHDDIREVRLARPPVNALNTEVLRALAKALEDARQSSAVVITGQPGAWLRLLARKAALLVNADEAIDTESQESYAEFSWPLALLGPVTHFGVLVPLAVAGVWLTWRDRREETRIQARIAGQCRCRPDRAAIARHAPNVYWKARFVWRDSAWGYCARLINHTRVTLPGS